MEISDNKYETFIRTVNVPLDEYLELKAIRDQLRDNSIIITLHTAFGTEYKLISKDKTVNELIININKLRDEVSILKDKLNNNNPTNPYK